MKVLEMVHGIIWGPWTVGVFLVVGLVLSVRCRFFQIRGFRYWWKATAGSLWGEEREGDESTGAAGAHHGITQFQSVCTALAATVGTGNIAGVAAALVSGGPGAVFWMWISALLGMATSFAENYLGAKYRTVQSDGLTGGVPFAYIKKAFGGKKLGAFFAGMFAVCCIGASFGIGNMAQVNSASMALQNCLGVPLWVSGILCAAVIAAIAPGGIHRLSKVTSWVIPIAAGGYLIGCLTVIIINYQNIPDVFARIFTEAFSFKAVGGGTVGVVMLEAMKWGVKRGVFSNEAGLGSSVMINANSSADKHHTQGMWAMLSVFIDNAAAVWKR